MKNKLKKIFIILFIISSATAIGGYFVYREYFSESEDENWMNEIALGQECGIDGMRCCKDKQPECNYSTCCQDPNNPKKDLCLEDCTCGKQKHFCCSGEKCDQGLACVAGVCQSCGGQDQPCCAPGNECGGGLMCSNGSCLKCGLSGNPCCLEAPACNPSDIKGNARIECQNGACIICGTTDLPVCVKNPSCIKGLLANNGYCMACGNLNQPCCEGSAESRECTPGLACKLGFCSIQ